MLIPKFQFRHTIEFLERGRLKFNKNVTIFSLWFDDALRSKGVRNFIYRDVPQLQYHNPNVQFAYFRNPKIGPLIRVYLDNQTPIIFDAENQNASKILEFVKENVSLTEEEAYEEYRKSDLNSACFGLGYKMWCICERPGQMPCPSRGYYPRPRPSWDKTEK